MVLPDRADVTMTVPFMRAYTELLAATCHRRGAHAMGGMAALIPSRRDAEANERALAGVRADKEREVAQGYDGTWVAHPDLVPVAREVFEAGLEGRAQPAARASATTSSVTPPSSSTSASTPGQITEAGLRTNVNVGFQYVSFWLTGRGAAAINSLMEDAATAEISRTQIWQWVHHGVAAGGRRAGHRRSSSARSSTRRPPRSARGRGGGLAGADARRRPASSSSGSLCRES